MRLFDKIRAPFTSSEDGETPPQASFAVRPDTVYAPLSGMLVSLQEIKDYTISQGLLGEGYGVVPIGLGYIFAPVSGRIDVTCVTNHAISVVTDDGVNVLIHVGIDTVKMEGRGFKRYVESNDEVRAGQPILYFDREAIRAAGYDDTVVVVVANDGDFEKIEHVGDSQTLISGRPLVKCGDPLLVVRKTPLRIDEA